MSPGRRDSLSAQLDLTVTKAESEQLARALQEEQYFELSQENKKAGARHKQEILEKDAIISRVSMTCTSPPLSPSPLPRAEVQFGWQEPLLPVTSRLRAHIVLNIFHSLRNQIKLLPKMLKTSVKTRLS